MADSFAMARFKGRLAREQPPRPRDPTMTAPYIADLFADTLMRAVTMAEITEVAQRLGLTFLEAYRERLRLYRRSPQDWPQVKRSE